jgi:AcrR family transcriptional regulator
MCKKEGKMVRNKEMHHASIVEAATKEFLKYGFKDASMRRIAANSGLCVSGLYRHFAGKKEMFSALVEPARQGLMDLYRREEADQKIAIVAEGIAGWENGGDAQLAMKYIYDHLDAFRLIVCKSQGTKYESFLHDLAVLEEEATLSFMAFLKGRGERINDFSEKELHLLVTTNVNAIFQAVEHGFSREDAMHYAKTLDVFFSKAWEGFFGY